MRALITSDIHLTDRPKDEYRFGLFPWLKTQAQRVPADYIFVLGDITDQKDNHSSKLTNRIVECFRDLSSVAEVFLLVGNHDYIDPTTPFFRFLNEDKLHFIVEPTEIVRNNSDILMLPHTRDPSDWNDIEWGLYDYVLVHQTFSGAKASNGMALEGFSPKLLKNVRGKIYSGDVHVPQKIGRIEYVGSPYHVHFGDNFTPRVVAINNDKVKDLQFNAPRKVKVELREPDQLAEFGLDPGDQISIKLKLAPSCVQDWAIYRKELYEEATKLGVEIHGIELRKQERTTIRKKEEKALTVSPQQAFDTFCKEEKIEDYMKEVGEQLL